MADGFSATMDSAAVHTALLRVTDTATKRTKPACRVSAYRIQQEARSRVARRTGRTAENILVTEVGDAYIIHTSDVRIDLSPIPGHTSPRSSYFREAHVGLWLEKGTRKGKPGSHASAPRPFFFVSAQLEQGPHERRIAEAMTEAIAEEGLGS